MARCAFGKILLAVLAGVCCSELAAQTVPTERNDQARGVVELQRSRPGEKYGRVPLSFEANEGQADEQVKFLSRGQGYTLFLTPSGAVFALHRRSATADATYTRDLEAIGIRLLGVNSQGKITGVDELPGRLSYFIGNDPAKWITGVPTYAKARYQHIYPGIDLVFYGNEQQLESDFVIAPSSDPNQIRLQFEGGRGLRVSSEGDLILKTSAGEVRLLKPHVYQEIAGVLHDIDGRYILKANRIVSFSLGAYNHAAPLVIDPILTYSTAINGVHFPVSSGGGHGIAVDATGHAYVTGTTDRSNFLPTAGAFTTATGFLFVSRLNPTGSAVDYTAVFGGSGSEVAMAITVDAQGEPIITGFTSSSDFPMQNALQPTLPAGTHAFVTKLNATGSTLLYSTYLGGSGATGTGGGPTGAGNAVATDSSGAIFVTGYTNSADFPTKNAVQPTCPDLQLNGFCDLQGFVTKLDPTQSGAASLVYSTFLGGKFPTAGQGIAVDASGNAYITGNTNATDFPTTTGAFKTTIVGGSDAFVSVLNPGGSGFVYSTYLGYGFGWGVTVDAQGDAYVTGATNAFGGAFPTTPGAFQTTLSGSTTSDHAFVTKLNSSGTALVYSTFLGGSGSENSSTGNIAIDAAGNAYISGLTSSIDFPMTANAIQVAFGGAPSDAFVAELNAIGNALIFSTYLGGAAGDQAYGLALDGAGSVYVMGTTTSANFPTTPGAFEPNVNIGTGTIFVTKIGAAPTTTTLAASVNPSLLGQQISFTATVSPVGSSPVTLTGVVTFSDEATTLATATISSGTAILNMSSLAVGSHSITAAYGGDSNFAPSTSVAFTQVVSQAGTSTTLSASPSPAILGQSVMVTANVGAVPPGAGTRTGTVTFLDGPTILGTGAVNSAGSATLSTSSLSSGSHSLTASYGGDANFNASTSTSVTLTVQSSAPPPTGPVFVAVNSAGPHIEQYTTTGVLQRSLSGGPTSNVYSGLAFGADGFLYVASTFVCGLGSCNQLEKFDPVAGTWVSSVGSITPNTNPFSGVSNNGVSLNGLALGPGNDLYVTTNQLGLYKIDPVANTTVPITTANCCTFGVAFLPDGTPLSIISSQNAVKNDLTGVSFNSVFFTSAQALAFGPDGRLNVLQYHEIDTVPGGGGAFTSLTASTAVSRGFFMTFDTQGHIWVTDINFGVLEFDSVTGQQINSFASNTASGFEGIAIAPLTAPATHLAVSAPASATAGTPFSLTVTALDASNNPATSYTGTVQFASTDGQAVLPMTYTFTAADHGGTHVFSGVTLNTAGSQTITATDTVSAAITGTSAPINVTVALTATHLAVSAPTSAITGTAFSVTVSALNAANQTSTKYTGTVHFTSSDLQAVLPSDYTFSAVDQGTHVFSNVTLNTAGSQTITATDTANASITGNSGQISVASPPPPVVQITDNEAINVSDAESFPDVFDAEAVHVTDAVFVTPLITVTAPVAKFSAGGLGFSGQSGTQTITVSDIGEAALTLASATISGGGQYNISQIACSNGATSLLTILPSGGACILTINYTASTTPANDIATLVFNDNAALSNVTSTPTGSSYTQFIALSGSGNSTPPPPPPPAFVSVIDNETIQVADTQSFPDVFDSETIAVTDQVTVQVISIPTTTSISASAVTFGTPASAVVSVTSAGGTVAGNVTLSVDSGPPSSLTLSGGSATFNLGVLSAGNHTLSATFAAQGSFNASSATATITVRPATPTIVWLSPAPITLGTPLTGVQLNATASIPGAFLYTPPAGTVLSVGAQTLSVLFAPSDSVDYTTATAAVTLNVVSLPVITSAATTTFAVGANASFTITASGSPAPAIAESGKLPNGVTLTDNRNGTATLSGTPLAGSGGIYPLTITAANGVGANATQSFMLTVDQGLAIISGTTTTFTVGQQGWFLIATAGFPVPALAETGNLPNGITFTDNGNGTATLAGIPEGTASTTSGTTAGAYAFTITASNGGVTPNITQNFALNVNDGTAILTGNITTFTVGVQGTFTVQTLSSQVPVITETGPLPPNLTFTDNGDGTATLAGVPTVVGNYPITLTANNGVDPAATQAFTLLVNQGPAITSTNSTVLTELVSGSFLVTTTGSPAPKLTEIGPLPTGVFFVDNGNGTAGLGGKPASLTQGRYGIAINASNGPGLSAVQGFTLTVNPNLLFASATSATFTTGSAGSFLVKTTGAPLPSLQEIGPLPAGITFVDNGNGTAMLAGTPAAGSVGSYPITMVANNSVGASARQYFTLTINAPIVVPKAYTFTSPDHTTFYQGFRDSFTIATTGVPTLAITPQVVGPGISFADNKNGTATLSYDGNTGLSLGTYTFSVTASGVGGAAFAAFQNFTLQVLARPSAPSFASADQTVFTLGGRNSSSSFTVAAGPLVTNITESGSLPRGVQFVDHHNGTATLGASGSVIPKIYNLTFTASNPSLPGYRQTQQFTLLITPTGTTVPQITSLDHAAFYQGFQASFTVTTTGSPAPALTMTPWAGNLGLYFVDNKDRTGTLSYDGSTALSPGTYSFTITATGAGGPAFAATQTFTLQVLTPPSAPSFTSPDQAVFTSGISNHFTVAAGPLVTNITESGSLPRGIQFVDHHNGTATLGASGSVIPKIYNLTFTASNPSLPGYRQTQQFTLLIAPVAATVPRITSLDHTEFWQGFQNSFTITTTGTPVPNLTITPSLGGLVMSFVDNKNGTATLTYDGNTFSSPGTYTFTITATGEGGATFAAVQNFTLQLFTRPSAPSFTSADQAVFKAGSVNFFIVAAGPMVTAITESGPLPPGVFFGNLNGEAALFGIPVNVAPNGALFKLSLTVRNASVRGYSQTQAFTLLVEP
jgi:hypothetical protein